MMLRALASAILAVGISAGAVLAESVHVAVAANFVEVAEQLATLFKAQTGHDVIYSFASTGQLFTQISQGAPFEVFLAADDERPAKAVAEGFGVEGTVFTYAIGQLALYSASLELSDGAAVLAREDFDKLAIADPATAPYGQAAIETLDRLGLIETIAPKFVTGENITQTLQFVQSGNAELGFVAASQVLGEAGVWLVPESFHEPIRQDAVSLKAGASNPAAQAYLGFLTSKDAREIIESAGYAVEP